MGFFGAALEAGAVEALWEVAPVVLERAGVVVGAGGDGVSAQLEELIAGGADDGEGGGGAGLDYEEEAGAVFPGGGEEGAARGFVKLVEDMADYD